MNSRVTRTAVALALAALWAGACGGGGSSSGAEGGGTTETITITSAAQIDCLATTECDVALQASGNASPLRWGLAGGEFPTGLRLDAATGKISGTPTTFGPPQMAIIQATDEKSSATKQFTFNIYPKDSITPIMPPSAHLHAPYSLIVNGVGVNDPKYGSISISAGSLPPGLTLTVGGITSGYLGIIAGTPTQAGTYPFTVQTKDTSILDLPQTVTASATIVVDTHLAIVKANLNNTVQGQAYSDAFAAVNGTAPFRWSVSGNVPSGLTVDSASGTLSGTATANAGSYAYSVSVSDASAPVESDTEPGKMTVVAPLQLQTVIAFPAYIGKAYSNPLYATGGTPPYKLSIVSGSLPPGLAINASYLLGTPNQLGTYNFTLAATDSGNPEQMATQALTITVTPTPLIAGLPVSPAPINGIYHSQIGASGGTPPYSWTVTSGNLPPGLTLNASTGAIDGTPTQSGPFSFETRVSDSSNPVQTLTQTYFIEIRKALGRNDSIATATPMGNNNTGPFSISPYVDPVGASTANPDTDYYRLVAAGGSTVHVETRADRSFDTDPLDTVIEILNSGGQRMTNCTAPSFRSGCMNDDIDSTTHDSALDVKVPGAANANTTFYLHVLDWRGDARPDMLYYLNVSGVIEPLNISPTTLGPGATRGVSYTQQFTTTGGTGSVTWSLSGGALPPGWSLNAAGLLSGMATTDGTYTFAIAAKDSANPAQTTAQQFTLQIAEPVVITSSATLPNACLNKPYSFQVTTTGGIPPLHYSLESQNWIGINPDQTGLFTGSSPVTGTFTASFGVSDSAQPISLAGQTISITVVSCP